MLHPTAAGLPGNLAAVPAGPISIRVSWTAPTSGADVTGYRIYWSGGSDQGSMDASAGDTTVTISGRSHGLTYNISIVVLSVQLPSPEVGPVMVTLGELNNYSPRRAIPNYSPRRAISFCMYP